MKNITDTVKYTVDYSQHKAHLFQITMSMGDAEIGQKLSLPAWTPGSYMIREFAQHIVSIKASEQGASIPIAKINKNTFVVDNKSKSIVIEYQVYAFDASIRAAYLDDRMAFFNGTALFLRPHGLDHKCCSLTIKPPPSSLPKESQVATNLKGCDVDSQGFGTYIATNYQSLVDHPFQISVMKRISFDALGIPHHMVLVGDVRQFDEQRLTKDLTKLCETTLSHFSSVAPFSSYLFIARFEEGGHGGLEHHNSSMLLASPYSLPKVGLKEPDAHYRNFLSLCAHEYYHAWNVKNLKPRNFVTYDFDQECYTPMLWIFEGITSYYDDLLVKRAGLISAPAYIDLMGKNFTRLLKTKGRLIQSVADSSFDAWIKFYRQNENSHNTSVSYYLKGSFIALMLDLLIRLRSNNERSLDNVMQQAVKNFGAERGIVESDFFAVLSDFGIDTESLKADFIYGTKELDLIPLLSEFGVELMMARDEGLGDDKAKVTACLGFKTKFDEVGRGFVSLVEQGGAAMEAGLCPHDEIIAINNVRLDIHNASDLLSWLSPAHNASILFARKKLLRTTTIIPQEIPLRVSKWSLKSAMNQQEQKRLMLWLGGSLE